MQLQPLPQIKMLPLKLILQEEEEELAVVPKQPQLLLIQMMAHRQLKNKMIQIVLPV